MNRILYTLGTVLIVLAHFAFGTTPPNTLTLNSQWYPDVSGCVSTNCSGWCLPTNGLTINEISFNANEKSIFFTVKETPASTWYFRYTWTKTGCSMDEAKGLYSMLLFCKANSIKILKFYMASCVSSNNSELIDFRSIGILN